MTFNIYYRLQKQVSISVTIKFNHVKESYRVTFVRKVGTYICPTTLLHNQIDMLPTHVAFHHWSIFKKKNEISCINHLFPYFHLSSKMSNSSDKMALFYVPR